MISINLKSLLRNFVIEVLPVCFFFLLKFLFFFRATIVGIGIYAFVLSKNSIDKQRYDSMKIRQRMRNSNFGEYEESNRKFGA